MRKFLAAVTAVLIVIVSAIGYGSFSSEEKVDLTPPAATSDDPTGLSGYYTQELNWENCGDSFECTKLTVPLDYANPAKKAIAISVIRLSAKENTLGSLILNPGGPGGSGISYARAAQFVTTEVIRANFDIVGFDPRGVGESTPIECIDDLTTDK